MRDDFPTGEALNGNVYSLQTFVINAYNEHNACCTEINQSLLNARLSHLRYKLFVCDIVDDEACGRL